MKGGRRASLAGLVSVTAALALVAAGAVGAGSEPVTVGGAFVHPALARQLVQHPSGVPAVVTTWRREGLDAVSRLGVRGTKLRTLPMMIVPDLKPGQLQELGRSPGVRSVWPQQRFRLTMEDTTWITRARYAWERGNRTNGLPGLDVTGRGIHVAVIDTGVDAGHEDMENVVEYCDTTVAVNATRTEIQCTPWLPATGNQPYLTGTSPHVDCANACDDNGHGTHVTGTIAGTGSASGGRTHPHSTIGIAPDAKVHVYSANVGASLFNHQILAAYDDLIYKKLRGVYPTIAVSNSWGGGSGYNPDSPQSIAFKQAYFAGILSVFAAGNNGPEHNTTSAQCNNPYVVCVAATTKPDHISMFSSRGRSSEPQDVNRDGTVGENEGMSDNPNHDVKLGRAFDVGRFRPTLSAPGVAINAAKASPPANPDATNCRETATIGTPAEARSRGCYVALQGTSMATPHVTGVVALLAEAYQKGHDNKLPRPQIITEILERSANEHAKLPGWESEEQGTGRLDAYRAVELAKNYPFGMKEPVLGQATPLYEAGRHPGANAAATQFTGCTQALSWTAPRSPIEDVIGDEVSPVATSRYGQHFIAVPPKADRLRLEVTWPRHPGTNLYLRLWRPGVDPDTAEQPLGGQTRAAADNEATGLTGPAAQRALTESRRFIEVRAPEETTGSPPVQSADDPELPSGLWTLRVYHRAGGTPTTCDLTSNENPKLLGDGYNYGVRVEIPTAQSAPSVVIKEPQDGAVIDDRWEKIGARASYAAQWEGITNYEVPGTENPSTIPEPDSRKVLHFHGNKHAAGDPRELNCLGAGNADALNPLCAGPFLLESAELSPEPAAVFEVATPLFNGGEKNGIDPSWTWYLTRATSLYGPMTLEWWASCSACDAQLGLTADWNIRIWADGQLKFQRRVTATPDTPQVPSRLEATVFIPTLVTANERFTIHVDPVYIDTQNDTRIYYDSIHPCIATSGEQPCDSLVRMPVVQGALPGAGDPPTRLRVTDLHSALRVAWNPAAGAQRYEIHRSLDPAFIPGPRTRIALTEGTPCSSPYNPTWPSYNRPGLCFLDTGGHVERTYYYRVVAVRDDVRSFASLLAYGMRTKYDRQTRIKVDRLYGPQYWEPAAFSSDPGSEWHHWWDTLELVPGPHQVSARAFSQGIGSLRDSRTYVDSGSDD